MADYAAFAEKRHKELEPLPWFAGGNGVGGLVAALTVMRWQDQWAGLVLFAPAVGYRLSPRLKFQRWLGPCLDCAAPRAKLGQRHAAADLNPDPEAVASFSSDPLCSPGPIRVRTAFQYQRGIDALDLMATKIRLPIFCEHSQGDRVADWEASREFCASVGSEDVTWLAPEGGCHDELSGKRALEFAGRIAAWLLKKSEPRKEEQAAAAAGGDDKGAVAAPAGADEPRDA
ncbi:hypothetical protein MNEG_4424 [Monoraphidium neglectum]|uniref:Serine aminopeptidase S33 domain-containing protein n=1 Tax=Monoraphidium neglectum TaxID=145388 RepID=A0A0D2JY50_9CHLO|nr:hypothetical protein MNEG_4424 [Monoraphidium neglectum]KIZ03533.1 hypothetical protein MNEG_4424 [Monoraphidium neglectum]|eukprot:XP_013902552.1 hypothetical protein MNEG_4424 [Monoraphidium neglectum]